MAEGKIRFAAEGDAARILEIYAPFVMNTVVSFEYDVPSLSEFSGRIRGISENYPYLVFEADGQIAGYAYASVFRTRAAYLYDVESSIYLSPDFQRKGIGRALYTALLEILKEMRILNVYATVTPSNEGSVALHTSMGFSPIGFFRNAGYKLGGFVDLEWYEKVLSDHLTPPLPRKKLIDLKTDFFEKLFLECSALSKT